MMFALSFTLSGALLCLGTFKTLFGNVGILFKQMHFTKHVKLASNLAYDVMNTMGPYTSVLVNT